MRVLHHYGAKCACCGEDEIDFLSIDHINNDGHLDRRRIGSGSPFYKDVAKRWPADLQVLCYNCNCAKGFFGICPHERKRASDSKDRVRSC